MWKIPSPKRCRDLKRLAVLTSGGDAPGMNAAIRAVARTALARGVEVYGVSKGYSGLVNGDWQCMDRTSVANILQTGGTILKTDRSDAFRDPQVRADTAERLRAAGIEALVVIGGDGSLTGAHRLEEETGFPVIGLPGTIDNDIFGTEDTIGFDTAVNTALESIDKLRDTATSHERVFVVEVMGRSSGFIATSVGIAGGAENIIMPGHPIDFQLICERLNDSLRRRKFSSLIVIAEGEDPQLTSQLTHDLGVAGYPARACILGHVQRGGSPTGHDRVLASYLGSVAVDYLLAGTSNVMVGVRKAEVVTVPLQDIVSNKKVVPDELIDLAQILAT
ncbi:6-phosphofructokinase [Alkalilimnicola ehrlichii]|uniref:ATP-dependent 6-phosphofructokinase n=1 Tax=Alkalilimnicola ehrlichii TaxID=351052 RepID=A0A3E0WX51_9GAMM|nr:6-phosphofructokinase [Alkalilimnicola ehrlichii]RFA30046.1 6-phosphofructokinase [Alkalilimnicola ehrlichii]RFA37388.1 6-phosphofructokinase [Alkalilimnicola ehrlichii]